VSASLPCRCERNRSHDDEFHRHALAFVLFGIYPPVIQTSVLTQKNFAARKRCGESGSEFWLQD
jgi:hypothetical protein